MVLQLPAAAEIRGDPADTLAGTDTSTCSPLSERAITHLEPLSGGIPVCKQIYTLKWKPLGAFLNVKPSNAI